MDERAFFGGRALIPRGRRREDRAALDASQWRYVVDDDLDQNDRDHDSIREEFQRAIAAAVKPLTDAQTRTNQILISILLTIGTGIILAFVTGQIGPK